MKSFVITDSMGDAIDVAFMPVSRLVSVGIYNGKTSETECVWLDKTQAMQLASNILEGIKEMGD